VTEPPGTAVLLCSRCGSNVSTRITGPRDVVATWLRAIIEAALTVGSRDRSDAAGLPFDDASSQSRYALAPKKRSSANGRCGRRLSLSRDVTRAANVDAGTKADSQKPLCRAPYCRDYCFKSGLVRLLRRARRRRWLDKRYYTMMNAIGYPIFLTYTRRRIPQR
jgi:hypothetical protein